MNPADLDERLARIAPTTSPDPDRLDAARAALDAVVDALVDGAPSPRSRRVGGAHVLDLDEARVGLGDDLVLPEPDDEVVVPLTRGRTARERRRRRVQLGAAAAGVVGMVAVGIALSPWPATPGPAAAPEVPCAAMLSDSGSLPEGDADPRWSMLTQDTYDGTDLALMRSPVLGYTGFCAGSGGAGAATSSTVLWTGEVPEPADGEVTLGGMVDDRWYVLWGDAGPGARSVQVRAQWSDERSHTSELVVDARRDGYGWSVLLPGDEVPSDARISLEWRDYGIARSAPLDSAWPSDGEAATALTAQRRNACTAGPDLPGLHPLAEKRYDQLGLTSMMNARRELVVCIQEADPPYDSVNTMSGPADAAPAKDEATVDVGGAADGARMLTGFAGKDVASVELMTPDDTVIEAELSDGYWVAWSTTVADEEWDLARLVWYLDDGSRHEE
ncbi:hypothetical protein [Isoptericola sp. NPDC055881]